MNKVAEKANLPKSAISVSYAGWKFENGRTLEDYMVEDGCTVRVALNDINQTNYEIMPIIPHFLWNI